MFQRVDAAIESGNGKAYLFRGDEYARYDIASHAVEADWPVKISKEWDMSATGEATRWCANLWTALNADTGKVYFFQGSDYIRYDLASDAAEDGWPVPIVREWNGMPAHWFNADDNPGIHAALNFWNGKVYFFRYDEYVRYDLVTDAVDKNYPMKIRDGWPGVWPDGVEAAVNFGDGLIYFFRGDEYLRFHIARNNVLAPPQPIPTDFSDLGAVGGGARGVAWGARVSNAFKLKVLAICARLGIEPSYLMAAMAFETGKSFSPSQKNQAGSGAVGLIQFMPSTAVSLGTTTEKLAAMSAEQQLDFVERYFSRAKGPWRTLADVYMQILFPAAVGKPSDFPLFKKPSTAYKQNAGLDIDGDGVVTKFEAAAKVRGVLAEGLTKAG